ncbi:hypothetical protein EYR41_001290 [Orbilia oligospora]|uniref:Uncharacterized protein n=1 Tax=Orbilia oligospora TaxID=2813651 RepID=A0A7C8PX93_ORBOL|nr:hypothetical protein TWF751_006121 [Orbilia oligospora]TGJ74260.1 hypothetical protein EYR41_001290 [Orbilia oligospora]
MAGINNFRREIYTVGWLCALPIELAAARRMLDDHHGNVSLKDTTTYMLGRIGKCNVVIACLPKGRIGITPAATFFTHMKFEFRAIKHWLLVGVGGGVPGPGDVRLGDVVVSYPTGSYGGVVQYDSGRSYPDGLFERTGYLNSPSTALLSALTTLQANWLLGESKLLENASRLDSIPVFARGGAGPDNLFRADYHHVKKFGGSNETSVTCGTTGICSKHKIISRKPREPQDEVIVHYGTIASGYQVIKDSKKRDEISALFGPDGILCFEMEAAGLMNDLQCLVIRGICDYADSHKNKRWQPYAAGMAAAYARELVTLIPTEEAARELEVLGERVIRTPKSLVSRSEASKTTRPSSTTANPASSSSDITSTITGSKFNGPTYLFVGTTGSNITVSSSTTPETTASNPEVSNKPNCKRRRGWVEEEEEDEEDDGYSSDDEEGITCFSCGRPGVIAPECECRGWSRQVHCYNCGRPGIMAPDCKCRDLCYDCGEEGHWQGDKECRLGPKRCKSSSRSRYEESPFSRGWSRSYRRGPSQSQYWEA